MICEDKNERRPRGTVRGRVIGLERSTYYELNAVQGSDAAIGRATVTENNALGTREFAVPVANLVPDQPVRLGLRVAGVVSLSARAEVTPDPATCAFAGER